MSKNLSVIQTIAKVTRIVLHVLYVISIVCGSICLAVAIMDMGIPVLKISDANIHISLEGLTSGADAFECIMDAIDFAASAVVLGFSVKYLKNELKAGTPFTAEGATELMILGIISAAVPIAADMLKGAATGIYAAIMKVDPSTLAISEQHLSSLIGLLLIAASFVLKYGAELSANSNTDAEQ